MPKESTARPSATQDARAQANPQNALTRAMDLERELTEEDYATNSAALQRCMRAWAAAR